MPAHARAAHDGDRYPRIHHHPGPRRDAAGHAALLRRLPRRGHRADGLRQPRLPAWRPGLPHRPAGGRAPRDAHRHSAPSARTTRPRSSPSRCWTRTRCGGWRTPRPSTASPGLDTHDGPLVLEVPPRVLGLINDVWGRYVVDVGNAGPDQGQGGKYLLLPPGHAGDVPDGYFVVRSRTFGNRAGAVPRLPGERRPAPGGRALQAALACLSARPKRRIRPRWRFVDISGAAFNIVPANDASFFEHVDRGRPGRAARGHRPGDAAACSPPSASARAAVRPRRPDASASWPRPPPSATPPPAPSCFSYARPDAYLLSQQRLEDVLPGNDYQFSPAGCSTSMRGRCLFYIGWGVTPAMTAKMVGIGSQYAYDRARRQGQHLDGGKTYRLHLPPDIPAKDFWSVLVYDPQTRSMLQTDQRFPSLSSQKEGIARQPRHLGRCLLRPGAAAGQGERTGCRPSPARAGVIALRLYGPLEPWFDQTWRPGEIEMVG